MTRQEFVTPETMGLLTDLYELTMAASYFEHCPLDGATFDLFVRKLPPQRSYLVFAGLEHACFYLTHLSFGPEAIRYLRSTGQFSAGFLKYLRGFRFRGQVDAMPEGSIFFPNEPVLRVSGNIIETQIVETYLLNAINLQSLIATKASRVVTAAQGRPVIEFGLRRAHGADAGMKGARAAYLAGCAGSSNVLAGQVYGIPVFGTMAHSFVQAFPSELEAFRAFAQTYPSGTTLLIDTFDTARGARHAVHVAKNLAREGHRLGGVRLDSGDLVALSQEVRKILDQEGLTSVKIFASGNLHEGRIAAMLREGACVDAFGVGTELSVSGDAPHLDVVYKLSEVVRSGTRYPTLKLSAEKQTFPGHKQVYRREEGGRIMEDVMAVKGEQVGGRPLLRPVLRNGRLVRALPSLVSVRRHAERERRSLPPALRELHSTTEYPVRISPRLQRMIEDVRKAIERTEFGEAYARAEGTGS